MTLRHIQIFVSVYQNGGITKASDALHLAQPSVSLAIKEIEEYYGIRLFERIGRRILPTECGSEFYSYALHIVSQFDEMEKKIRNWETLGTLRIGASITIGTHVLPGIIKEMQLLFPDLTIEAVIKNSAAIEQHILDNGVDIGLIETVPEQENMVYEPFMEDFLCAIVSPSHPLNKRDHITLTEIADYDLLMREKGSAGREILEGYFSMEQLSVHPLWESTSTQAIVKGVSSGIGISVLPYLLVEKDIAEGIVKRVPINPRLKRNFNIIYHRSKYLTSTMNAFMELCKMYGREV